MPKEIMKFMDKEEVRYFLFDLWDENDISFEYSVIIDGKNCGLIYFSVMRNAWVWSY
jgi:hypothetical protein